MRSQLLLSTTLAFATLVGCDKMNMESSSHAAPTKREITLVNYEQHGIKQWVPGTIVVNQGDEVTINLINKVPSGAHGFEIPEYKVVTVVTEEKNETVTFKATNKGIFPFKCHMHPTHIGGQIVVR